MKRFYQFQLIQLLFQCICSINTPFAESFATATDDEGWNSHIISGYKTFHCGVENEVFIVNQAILTKLFTFPPHSTIQITADLLKINSWQVGDTLSFHVDSHQISATTLPVISTGTCEQQNYLYEKNSIDCTIHHNFNTALFVISPKVQANDKFLGIKNLKLFVSECPNGCNICRVGEIGYSCRQWIMLEESLIQNAVASFTTEGWLVSGGTFEIYDCLSIPLIRFGGTTQVTKLYNLLPHSSLIVHFRYFKLDSWDIGQGDNSYFRIDSNNEWQWPYPNWQDSDFCGGTWFDFSGNIEIIAEHSKKQTEITFQCHFNSGINDESFGIRDVQIFTQNLQCTQFCGDSIIQIPEDCDDGNLMPFDGCYNCQYSCLDGCSNCINGVCYECLENWIYIENIGQCILITIQQSQLEETFQLNCPLRCSICISQTCIQCIDNYKLNPITNTCQHFCEDCTVNRNEQCDNGNNDIYDCYDQLYLVKYHKCDDNCSFCFYGDCQRCNFGYSLSNNSCLSICGDNLVDKKIQDGYQVEQCDNPDSAGCDNCIISPSFQCVGEDYSICWTCNSKCTECYQLEGDLKCNKCIERYFSIGSDCQLCDNNCITCDIQSDMCTSCYRNDCKLCEDIPGLYTDYQQKKCTPQCGDGILIKFDEECDDGNLVNDDGCDSTCKIEIPIEKITSPTIQRYKGDKSNDLSISNFIDIVYNCSDIFVTIEGFLRTEFKFNSTSFNNGCAINFVFLKSIYSYNLIHIKIVYQLSNKRILADEIELPAKIPIEQIILTNDQQSQADAISSSQSSFFVILWIIAPLSMLFGVFEYFWAVLEILSWINNFYFLNVTYPFNVQILFLNSDWSKLINFPTYQEFNQPECMYYFQAPKKFMEKNMDPLFINNAQVPFAFILFSIVLYYLSILALLFIKLVDKILTKEITKPLKPLQLFKILPLKQRTIYRTVQTIQNSQQIVNGNTQTTITTTLHNTYAVQLKIYFKNINMLLWSRIKSTISLCLLDITMAITLQLLFATEFQYSIIALNELFALLSIVLVGYNLFESYFISNVHPILLDYQKFQLKFGFYLEGVKKGNSFGFWFQFFRLLRKILFIIFTVYYYQKPLFQTSLCFLACVTGVMLMIYQNPFGSKRKLVQQLISEGCVSIIIFIAILFALDDQTRKFGEETKIILGWLIITSILLALLSEILTLIYEILKSCYLSLKKWIAYVDGQNNQKGQKQTTDKGNVQQLQFHPSKERNLFKTKE